MVRVCAWFGVDDSLGLLVLGEAITHLNKNDEPPSVPLCLHTEHLQLLHREVILIHKFNEYFFPLLKTQKFRLGAAVLLIH